MSAMCNLGCVNDCRAAMHGVASECPALPRKSMEYANPGVNPPPRPDRFHPQFMHGFSAARTDPLPMVLHCPKCTFQHVDKPDGAWTNPPHRSHLCKACGHIWRPADFPTTGVQSIQTKGRNDS